MPLSTVGTGREDVTTTPWPVPEERRTVTVLFADIVGSTGLTERLDPEDVRAVQRAYFDTVAGVLHRWQGAVEKYVGDAVMALFGARTSDGLDAYRAVRAGLEIQAALDRRALPGGVALRVRVGVATGEAVVDLAAARDGGHGMASGAVLTTAARIQEYAPPGGVVVCSATHRATAGLVDQHALAPASLTGKALPVDVWRVTGATRPRPARHHGPLVGRRRETATAREQLTRAAREHRPRWVALVGPDGIGRSRLLHELRHGLPDVDGTPVRWAVAHCPPYPEAALGPVAELLRDLAGLPVDGPATAVRPRLTALVDGLVPAGRTAATVDALAALLAAPARTTAGTVAAGEVMADGAAAGAMAAGAVAVRQVLLGMAGRQPVVVAVDDLDRAAPELSRFLHTLFAAATARGLPLAVLATHRPHRADPLPLPSDRQHRVELAPLAAVDAGRLLRRLLSRAGHPAALATRLVPLVAGRPGYAVAYVDALDQATGPATTTAPGAPAHPVTGRPGENHPVSGRGEGHPVSGRPGEPALPESVRRSAAARLDRFDGTHRAVLMAAATLDAEFTGQAVDELLGWPPGRATAALRRLATEGLLRSGRRGGYVIADPALRRCAYDRLPRAVRAEFARRANPPRPTPNTAPRRHPPRQHLPRPARPQQSPATTTAHPTTVAADRCLPGSWRETAPGGAIRHQDLSSPEGVTGISELTRTRVLARGPGGGYRGAGSAGGADRDRADAGPGGRHRWVATGHGPPSVDAGPHHAGSAVVVPLLPRRAGVRPGHEAADDGRRRRGEGMPRPAVPLRTRAA
ncbi:adenylate/guanylate cyclase domain-containing protein [Micromonospora sp. NPDC092111]|uniref:adenylate/guanylate cyclase domain-containing protein n=1 Tax=Micromonospora sp. NPDC092111 TaxID=3364289 RepID=UPI003804BCAF